MQCLICDSNCSLAVTTEVLGMHTCNYFKCDSCSFIFAENPHWLERSFSEIQSDLDIGAVDRVSISSKLIEVFLRSVPIRGRCIDFGGGYGVLTRIMRDKGFDYFNFDPYTKPILSKRYSVDSIERADFYSLIEVSLHFTNPISELREISAKTPLILMTAVVPPENLDSSWWYLSPDTGQHVAIYSIKTLEFIAADLGMNLLTDGKFFHVFYAGKLKLRTKFFVKHSGLGIALGHVFELLTLLKRGVGKSTGLLESDSEMIKEELPWRRHGGVNEK